jgi:hypothetical protein
MEVSFGDMPKGRHAKWGVLNQRYDLSSHKRERQSAAAPRKLPSKISSLSRVRFRSGDCGDKDRMDRAKAQYRVNRLTYEEITQMESVG